MLITSSRASMYAVDNNMEGLQCGGGGHLSVSVARVKNYCNTSTWNYNSLLQHHCLRARLCYTNRTVAKPQRMESTIELQPRESWIDLWAVKPVENWAQIIILRNTVSTALCNQLVQPAVRQTLTCVHPNLTRRKCGYWGQHRLLRVPSRGGSRIQQRGCANPPLIRVELKLELEKESLDV